MSEVKDLTPRDVEKQTESLMGEKSTAVDYIKLFSELFAAEYRMEQNLRLKDIYPPISKIEIKRRLDANLPVIDPGKIDVGEAALAAFLERIIPILRHYAPGASDIATSLVDGEKVGKINLRELVRALVAGDADYLDKTTKLAGAGRAELTFIISIMARPLMRRLASFARNKDGIGDVVSDRCPVCGGAPLMARIGREDTKRVLECSLCGTSWTARRIRCLGCGNEDDTALGFIYLEDEACRIDKCDKCHSYIKTLDERKRPEDKGRALRIEDVATLHLDILAEEKGYHSLR